MQTRRKPRILEPAINRKVVKHMANQYSDTLLNSSILNFAQQELSVGADLDEILGGTKHPVDATPGRPNIVYSRRPRTVEILDNGDVQFTVKADGVRTVEVGGRPGSRWGTERTALRPLGGGWFQGTVSGIPAGLQYMNYYYDGVEMLNPDAPIGYGYGKAVNTVDVPDPEDDSYLCRDVPHGAVRYELYRSSYTGATRACWVYTPPGYDTDTDKAYPVWYIQHGGGENETGWFWQGKVHFILDNLLAEGKCREMLVVANAGYAFPADAERVEFLPGDLGRLLRDDCIPFIERRFRVLPGPENRALSGLSLGSYQTMDVACRYPELFDYLGIFSGGIAPQFSGIMDAPKYMRDTAAFNAQHKLLFYGHGLQEGGEQRRQELAEWQAKGLQAELFTCPGVHEWQVWRKTACVFARKLFR